MRLHPRLASLLVSVIIFLILGLLYRIFRFHIAIVAIVAIVIILTTTVGTIIYHHLVNKYDDDDMII